MPPSAQTLVVNIQKLGLWTVQKQFSGLPLPSNIRRLQGILESFSQEIRVKMHSFDPLEHTLTSKIQITLLRLAVQLCEKQAPGKHANSDACTRFEILLPEDRHHMAHTL